MKAAVRFLAQGLLTAGAVALCYVLLIWFYAAVFQLYGKWAFERSTNDARPIAGAQFDPSAPRSVIGRIDIPSLNLSTLILEGTDERELLLGAGHIPGTALPGQIGNVVLAAHRDTFFRPLEKIRKNDMIVLTTRTGAHQYLVESMEITGPKDTEVLKGNAEPTLTLITCYPFDYLGQAKERFVVRARKVV